MISDPQPKRKLKQNRLPLWDWIRLAKPYRIYTGMDEAECIEALRKIARRTRTRSFYQFEVSVETPKGFKITESYSSRYGGYKKRTLIDGVLQTEASMGVVQISGYMYYGQILLETAMGSLVFLSGILLLYLSPEVLYGVLAVLGGISTFAIYHQGSKSRRRMLQEIRTELKTIEGRNFRKQG